mmetsp:Transcript_16193/g.27135  ORF Transcript_16193/g.27135 Transcript_16193/m.27135 type:complete len:85 (-) Transcript_16193:823-1077(-)
MATPTHMTKPVPSIMGCVNSLWGAPLPLNGCEVFPGVKKGASDAGSGGVLGLQISKRSLWSLMNCSVGNSGGLQDVVWLLSLGS